MPNADTSKKSSRLLTPPFRVSFPSVFEKASYNNGTPRFSVVGLFYPKDFSDSDKEKWKAILAKLDEVSKEGFKKGWKELDRGVYKVPFHKGDEKDYQGYGDPNMIFFTMANAKRRPQIVDVKNNPITSENAEEFYAGCWARASVNPYWFNNIGKGLAIGLGNLQKIKDDESFEGFTSAEDDFGNDDEFGSAGGDDDDFGLGGGGDDPTS
jgi:hypothetical protein